MLVPFLRPLGPYHLPVTSHAHVLGSLTAHNRPLVFRVTDWTLTRFRLRTSTLNRFICVWLVLCAPSLYAAIRRDTQYGISFLWLLWDGTTAATIILFSWWCWNTAVAAEGDIAELFDHTDTQETDNRFRILMSPAVQILFMLIGAASIEVAALQFASPIVERQFSVYFSLALSGAAAGHGLHLVVGFTSACYWISHSPNLRLFWATPLETPGLRSLSRLLTLGSGLGLILYALVAVPLTWAITQSHGTDSRIAYLAGMSAPVACLTAIGILSQVFLAVPVRRATSQAIADLQPALRAARDQTVAEPGESKWLTNLETLLSVESMLSSAPESYLRGEVVAQYTASSAAALLPIVISLFLAR